MDLLWYWNLLPIINISKGCFVQKQALWKIFLPVMESKRSYLQENSNDGICFELL